MSTKQRRLYIIVSMMLVMAGVGIIFQSWRYTSTRSTLLASSLDLYCLCNVANAKFYFDAVDLCKDCITSGGNAEEVLKCVQDWIDKRQCE